MKKTKLLAASLFMLTLASCDGMSLGNNTKDTYEVTEDVWKNTFENWNVSNGTLMQTSEANSSYELTVKVESRTKVYVSMYSSETYVYEENGKYYVVAQLSQNSPDLGRMEITKQEFESTLYDDDSPVALIFSSDIPDQLDLVNGYSTYAYNDSKKSYVGSVDLTANNIVAHFSVEIKFLNNKVTSINVIPVDSEGLEGTDYYLFTTTIKDIGTTSFDIPTNYVDITA